MEIDTGLIPGLHMNLLPVCRTTRRAEKVNGIAGIRFLSGFLSGFQVCFDLFEGAVQWIVPFLYAENKMATWSAFILEQPCGRTRPQLPGRRFL